MSQGGRSLRSFSPGLSVWRAIAIAAALLAAPAVGAPVRDCSDCPELVIIPAQSIRIGVSEDVPDRRTSDRMPVTAQIGRPFAMARTETTRAQYAAFIAQSGFIPAAGAIAGCNFFNGIYGYVASLDWRNPGFLQRDSEPVLCVSYHDAAAYAAWLTRKTGRKYRVPSSVEWDVAARAGSTGAFPWGNASDKACEYANIADRSYGAANPHRPLFDCDDTLVTTAPAGRYKPNAYGLADMIGNAWEWTSDCWRDDLGGAPIDGRPVTAALGGDCAFRSPVGGGWISGIGWARLGARSKDPVGYRSFMLGFRVAAEINEKGPN